MAPTCEQEPKALSARAPARQPGRAPMKSPIHDFHFRPTRGTPPPGLWSLPPLGPCLYDTRFLVADR